MFGRIFICVALSLTPTIAASQTLVEIRLDGGAFCRAGLGSDAEAVVGRLTVEADGIARKAAACANQCAPRVNHAEFCAYGSQLTQDGAAMVRLGNAAANAARLFDEAVSKSHHPLSALSTDFSSTASAATGLLGQTVAALQSTSTGSKDTIPDDAKWWLVARAIDDTSAMLAILSATDLATGDVADLSHRLEFANTEFPLLHADAYAALNGADPLSASSIENLVARLEALRVTLEWVERSFTTSADMASRENAALISVGATALPPAAASAGAYREAARCFTRLSLTMTIGNRAAQQSRQQLADCRAFKECGALDPAAIPDLSLFQQFVARADERAKTSAAVTGSMCRP